MKSFFPQYALVYWTLGAPLILSIVEWFLTRRQRSAVTMSKRDPSYNRPKYSSSLDS
jgi:hypothetical protein